MFYDAYLTLLRKKSALIFCPVLYMMLALPAPLNTYGQHAAAIDSMKTEIRKYPDDPELLAMLAEQYEMISTDSAAYYGSLLLAQSAGDDQYTAKACQLLSDISLLKNDLDSAVFFLKKGIAAVKQGGLEYETALYTQALGQLYLNKGDIKEAVPEFNVGLNYFLNHHDAEKRDERLVFIYGGLGDCYTQSGLYALAIKYLQLALQHAEKLNDPVSKAINYNSILAVYQNMKDYEKSIHYGALALKEFDKADYPLGYATVLLNMATNYHLLENTDRALQLLDTAEKIIVSLNTTYNLGEIYTLYGDIYRKQKDYDKSTDYLNRAIRIHEQSGAKLYWGTALATLAQNQFDEGKKGQAQQTAIRALHIFNEIDVPKEKSELLYFLIRSNMQQGSALASYLDQYMKTQSRYLNEEKVKAVTAQEIKYETSLKEARIARQQAELETGRQQRHYLLIGGGLALAAAAGLGLQYRRTRKQKALIQKQKQEILHNNRNSIQQLISIFGRQAHTEAEQALALANQERLITLNILNKMLYEHAGHHYVLLAEYLQRLADAKSLSTHIPIDMTLRNKAVRLRGDLLKDVGLIINELIANSAKHAFGNTTDPRICIETATENNQWLLINYRDNGVGLPAGFDIRQQGASFGLDFVCDLVEQHHGTIQCSNDHGACFRIRLKIT